ncbi:MAG: YifB family Mg chelatase-like AAA ATPase [Candidatus Eisenbacteria bacterium]|nr:YifB family Mg chelatase-like AAA ATPase [Candidatus Eisenbacteria bacterium]
MHDPAFEDDENDPPGSAPPERVAQAISFALIGVEARTVAVEVSVTNGYPRTAIVGMPDLSVRESRERVEAAIKASGLPFPARRVTINLSPAEIPKEGANFDLPVALAVLAGQRTFPPDALEGWAIAGELSLDGAVRPVRGVLAMAVTVSRCGARRRLMVPIANAAEAAIVEGIETVGVATLREAVDALKGRTPERRPSVAPAVEGSTMERAAGGRQPDLADVRGQSMARRAVEIAVAGGHNILLIGSPGAGKTLLAQRIPGILPPMTRTESLETTLVYSAAGQMLRARGLLEARPFRSPHSSISGAGLVGGGRGPRPGEVSLSHNGVLFLDELPEFAPSTLNLLRQPLEEGRVTIVRAHGGTTFPARFVLVAAMNPCPCGFLGDRRRACSCPPMKVRHYRSRVSGPLLDRIDLHIEVPRVSLDALSNDAPGESSAAVRERVLAARAVQTHRFRNFPGIHCNAQMDVRLLTTFASPETKGRGLLRLAAERVGLSGRAYHRILRVARTIADMNGDETIQVDHVAEAIQYRVLDRAEQGVPET